LGEGSDFEELSDPELSDLELSDLELSDLELSDLELSDLELSDLLSFFSFWLLPESPARESPLEEDEPEPVDFLA